MSEVGAELFVPEGWSFARIAADRLTQAVLSKAFRGELVATEAELARWEGRGFETAEQLLARIRAARPAAPPSRRAPTAQSHFVRRKARRPRLM